MRTQPHFGNLRKRAKALGMEITKTTDLEDARMFGHNLFLLHEPGKLDLNQFDITLWGIRSQIESLEQAQ